MQYYNLIHLGFTGYREIMENCLANARIFSQSIEATGWYTCLSDIHRLVNPSSGSQDVGSASSSATYTPGLPVIAFRFSDAFRQTYPHIKQETVSLLLRARQWIVPNYALPPDESETEILRVVVRVSMSFDLLDRLVTDLVEVTETLMERDQVDLSVLQTSRRARRGQEPAKKGEEGDREEGGGKGEKSAEEGLHRAVC